MNEGVAFFTSRSAMHSGSNLTADGGLIGVKKEGENQVFSLKKRDVVGREGTSEEKRAIALIR